MTDTSRRASSPRPWWPLPSDLAPAVWGLLIGIGACWPLMGNRRLYLLDWVFGPHASFPTPWLLGLNGGLTSGAFNETLMTGLVHLIGPAATWLPILAVFPLAAWSVGRLVGGSLPPRLAAATFFCVNPWVFNRVYVGHIPLLLGYALLPLAVRSALAASRRRGVALLGPALWWAVLTALSPHYAWIYGVVLLAAAAVGCPRSWVGVARRLGWLAANAAAFAVTSLYILLPHAVTQLPTTVGAGDLAIYRTTGDPHLGLFPNVAGLYGFWRPGPGPQMAKDVVAGWPLLLLALLVVVAVGFVAVLRSGDAERRRLAWVLVVVGIAGYFLALGDQGPTGPLYRWAYDTVPFFAVMREAQKFLVLLALAYALGFGWGVERLAARRAKPAREPADGDGTDGPPEPIEPAGGSPGGPEGGRRRRWRPAWAAAAVGLVLPLAYTPTIFDGLDGQIAPSTVPPAYARADALMGTGPGQVLYLPWHLYEAQPFTGGRVVASFGPTAFRRPVIAGDNVEVGPVETQSTSPRSAYLRGLLGEGPSIADFGAQVAPLGVAYVVLAHTVDWRRYGWLDHQADLRPVLADGALQVWRNTAYQGVGRRAGATAPVRRLSPVAYAVPGGDPGTVTVDAAYQPGWELHGRRGRPTPQGTVQFTTTTARGGVARFTPWGQVRLGYELSLGAFVLLAAAVAVDRRRRRRAPRDGR